MNVANAIVKNQIIKVNTTSRLVFAECMCEVKAFSTNVSLNPKLLRKTTPIFLLLLKYLSF